MLGFQIISIETHHAVPFFLLRFEQLLWLSCAFLTKRAIIQILLTFDTSVASTISFKKPPNAPLLIDPLPVLLKREILD